MGKVYVPSSPRVFAGDYRKVIQRVWGACEYLAKNNHYCRSAILLLLKNIIGQGLTLRPNIADKEKKRLIEKRWQRWVRESKFHSIELQALYSFLVYGEAFVLLAGDANNLKFSIVAPPRLRPDLDRKTYKSNKKQLGLNDDIVLGIEFKNDSLKAYHFLTKGNSSTLNQTYLRGGQTVRVPASMCQHIFLKLDPEAIRGYPWMASGINSFLAIDKYNDAELAASILASSVFGIASPLPDDNTNFTGQGADDLPEDDAQQEQITLSAKAGTVLSVDSPINLQTFAPTHPSGQLKNFLDLEIGAISASLGLASFEVNSDLRGVNYSSGRLGNLNAHSTYVFLRNLFIEELHYPIFKRWLNMERRNLPISEMEYEDLLDSKFVGVSPKYLDPVKNATSVQRRIRSGMLSLQEAIEEEGRDFSDTLALLKQAKEAYAENDLIEVWNSIFQVQQESDMDAEDAAAQAQEDQEQQPQQQEN